MRDTTSLHYVAPTGTGVVTEEGSAPPEHRPCNGRSQGRPVQVRKNTNARKVGKQSPPVPPGQRAIANVASLGATTGQRAGFAHPKQQPRQARSTSTSRGGVAKGFGVPADEVHPTVPGQKRRPLKITRPHVPPPRASLEGSSQESAPRPLCAQCAYATINKYATHGTGLAFTEFAYASRKRKKVTTEHMETKNKRSKK